MCPFMRSPFHGGSRSVRASTASSFATMTIRNVPPTCGSSSTVALRVSPGHIQRAMSTASSHAANTRSRGTRSTRRTTSGSASAGVIAQQYLEGVEPGIPVRALPRQPARRRVQWPGPEAQPVLAAADAARHQPGALQHLHVLGHRVERHGKAPRESTDVHLSAGERGEDGAPGGAGDGAIDLVQPAGTGLRHGLFIIQPIGRISDILRSSARPITTRHRMTPDDLRDHPVVSHDRWIAARTKLLAKEKELTRTKDEVSRLRRALPWERVDKTYVFEGPDGKQTLAELFGAKSQLFVYHFMFGPEDQ